MKRFTDEQLAEWENHYEAACRLGYVDYYRAAELRAAFGVERAEVERLTKVHEHNVDIDSFYTLFQSRANKLRLILETMGHDPLHGLDFAMLAGQDRIAKLEQEVERLRERNQDLQDDYVDAMGETWRNQCHEAERKLARLVANLKSEALMAREHAAYTSQDSADAFRHMADRIDGVISQARKESE